MGVAHLALLALAVVVAHPAAAQAGADADAVVVGAAPLASLQAALGDAGKHRIIVASNYSISDTLDHYKAAPLRIDRNVTITGPPGSSEQNKTVLDLAFRRALLKLCGRCTLTFANITVANDRRSTGAAFDIVLGEPGSKIVMRSMYKLRPACTSAFVTAETVRRTARSRYFPRRGAPQEFEIVNVTYNGRAYDNALFIKDYTADIPALYVEGRGDTGGTAHSEENTVRLCRAIVSPDCLERKSPEACINELVDAVTGEAPAGAAPAAAGLAPSALAAAIAVPITVAVLLAAAGLLLCARRRRRSHGDAELGHTPKAPRGSSWPPFGSRPHSKAFTDGADTLDSAMESGLATETGTDGTMGTMGTCSSFDDADTGKPVRKPLGLQKGWAVMVSHTSPFVGAVDNANRIEFGELLGAGSFGRVYRAVWAGRSAAVKVIEHDTSNAPAVENEVQLMLSFNHANVVKAWHYVTWAKVAPPTSQGSGASSAIAAAMMERAPTACSAGGSQHGSRGPLPPVVGAMPAIARSQSGGSSLPDAAAAVTCADQRPTLGGAGGGAAGTAGTTTSSGSGGAPSSAGGAQSARDSAGALPELGRTLLPQPSTASTDFMPAVGARLDSVSSAHARRVETWLVQEFCDLGTLGLVAASWLPSTECDSQMLERLLLLQDCARGLAVLHANFVVHGDLNARNVLVSSDASVPYGRVAKLADLGLSRVVKQHMTHHTTNSCGTMSHSSPELLRYGRMSAAVDIYAFGVMMWELYTGEAAFRKLFYGQFFETVVLHNLRPTIPAGMPEDFKLLMISCWSTDPADRPTVDTVLQALAILVEDRQQRVAATTARERSAHGGGLFASFTNLSSSLLPKLAPPSVQQTTVPALLALLRPAQAQASAVLPAARESSGRSGPLDGSSGRMDSSASLGLWDGYVASADRDDSSSRLGRSPSFHKPHSWLLSHPMPAAYPSMPPPGRDAVGHHHPGGRRPRRSSGHRRQAEPLDEPAGRHASDSLILPPPDLDHAGTRHNWVV